MSSAGGLAVSWDARRSSTSFLDEVLAFQTVGSERHILGGMARPRKFDEDEVLAVARRKFTETGYHGTSVQDLSEVTGLSKGSLYGAFRDKEALFRRVFEDYCAASDETAAALLEGPEERALGRARAWLRSVEGPSDRRGCLLAKGTAELSWENEAVAARALAAFETLIDSLRRLVEQAQRRPARRRGGTWRTDPHHSSRPRSARKGRSRFGNPQPRRRSGHRQHHARSASQVSVRGPRSPLRARDGRSRLRSALGVALRPRSAEACRDARG